MLWETSNYKMVILTEPHKFVSGNREIQVYIVITEYTTNIMILKMCIEGQ
jgi:hypothetical protein